MGRGDTPSLLFHVKRSEVEMPDFMVLVLFAATALFVVMSIIGGD